MSNIVKFPPQPQEQRGIEQDGDSMEGANQSRSKLAGVLAWLWAVVRLPLFLVLYWLRGPVVFLCNLVAGPALLGFLFGLYFLPQHRAMVWGVGGMSFAAFAMRWAYDSLLMWLSLDRLVFTY
jgi:hypothetical protein